jgi:3-oxoacyl-[acyl-carrier protein] reductase
MPCIRRAKAAPRSLTSLLRAETTQEKWIVDLNIDGLRVLVTAASQGLGLACARSLTNDGAHVIVSSRSEERLKQAQESNGLFGYSAADLSSADDIASLVADATAQLGGLDAVVVNCGPPPAVTFSESSEEDWADALGQVTMSAIRLAKAALPEIRKSGRGRLIFIIGYGWREPISHLVVSEATRAPVQLIAKVLSRELAVDGVTVNTIAAGPFLTDRVHEVGIRLAEAAGTSLDEQLAQMVADIPVGRLGDPNELGDLCAFLCSARASFISGQTIVIDGGSNRAV